VLSPSRQTSGPTRPAWSCSDQRRCDPAVLSLSPPGPEGRRAYLPHPPRWHPVRLCADPAGSPLAADCGSQPSSRKVSADDRRRWTAPQGRHPSPGLGPRPATSAGPVCFRSQPSEDQRWKTMPRPAPECIRRLWPQVWPPGFPNVRDDGRWSPGHRPLLHQLPPCRAGHRCPSCGQGLRGVSRAGPRLQRRPP
jgi:hypothetical protein